MTDKLEIAVPMARLSKAMAHACGYLNEVDRTAALLPEDTPLRAEFIGQLEVIRAASYRMLELNAEILLSMIGEAP